jgi:hypothetical protein
MKKLRIPSVLMIALIGVSILTAACKKEGCTDPLASNYNNSANHDDGSCEYDGITPGTVTTVEDDVDVPTTWSAETITICSDIYVNAALTIQPGVTIVMCAGASISIEPEGYVSAIGTAVNPIIFKGEVASAGYWEGIGVESNNPNNQFNYVTVSDAGSYWGWDYSNVYVGSLAKLSVQNSTFGNSEGKGLYMEETASFTAFSHNTFSSNALAGLNITALQVGSIDAASSYNISNGENFIHVRSATLGTNATWPATTTPMLLHDGTTVNAGLTISAGANILMEAGASISIEESGYLTALGTASQPINFSGRYASAGYWRGIDIKSNNPNNQMTHVNYTDGGAYWAYDYATLNVLGRLSIDNCSISNSNSWAMHAGGSASIYCSGAVQTDAAGVMTVNTISGNGAGPDADCLDGGCTVLFD